MFKYLNIFIYNSAGDNLEFYKGPIWIINLILLTINILAHKLLLMSSKRLSFIFISVLQFIKIIIAFLLIVFYSILNDSAASFSISFFASEFALCALFLNGIFYPEKMGRHNTVFVTLKVFSTIASLSLLLILIIRNAVLSGNIAGAGQIKNQIIFFIILIVIDFATLFILVLNRGGTSISKIIDIKETLPEYIETLVEDE